MPERLTRSAWLDHGMAAMAKDGPAGLTLEAMCARTNKTRGSFYHHFASAADFQKKLLVWWEKTCTHDLIEKIERLGQSGQNLDHLNQLAAHFDPRIEKAFRRLAASSKGAARTCRSVDNARIAYLTKLYQLSPRYSPEEAQMLAQIEYAAWVGFLLVAPDAGPREMLEMYQAFLKLTGRR